MPVLPVLQANQSSIDLYLYSDTYYAGAVQWLSGNSDSSSVSLSAAAAATSGGASITEIASRLTDMFAASARYRSLLQLATTFTMVGLSIIVFDPLPSHVCVP
jgi:hypothetical protein